MLSFPPGFAEGDAMENAYVEQRDGCYWIKGTRISLDSIVHAFNRGAAPESIKRSFPLLSLEEIYGAITFYLSHEHDIDAYLAQSEADLDSQSRERNIRARSAKPELFDRFAKARQSDQGEKPPSNEITFPG
jgi:uncharacterized protein (DUF433 family)